MREAKEWEIHSEPKLSTLYKITLSDQEFITLPTQMSELRMKIEESKYILELGNNWDDDGAIEIKKSTWIRAIKFLVKYSMKILDVGKIMAVPIISPNPNGSIDLGWKSDSYIMLINIPEDSNILPSYYGNNRKQNVVKGLEEIDANTEIDIGLTLCLANLT